MIDLLLVVLLVGGLITGFRRGLVVQIIHMFGLILSIYVAYKYYKPLADKLVLWIPYPGATAGESLTWTFEHLDLDMTFYRLIAFIFIFVAAKLVLQLIGSMLDFLKHLPVLGFGARILGAGFGFIEFYLILFFLLSALVMLPIEVIQNSLDKSLLAKAMFEHTPIISSAIKNWWFVYLG
ncbi:CvpA family protein [Sporosarcina sp. PTS2304]|uniref:CvpA family protein n=1 Tax=Sporosarcina sp. PTS2304 TaxID=2283194 RepID=UPI000E0DF2A4|nr:CvpA family protein [Sporosarcina sp. PTS2304]AXH99391.1 CvpA family protein [Sporosarcina sp. PTS2304]